MPVPYYGGVTDYFERMDAALQPTLNVWAFLFLFAAAQGLFLSLVLVFLKRGNRTANRFLAALVFVFSLRLVEVVAYWTKYLLIYPHFFSTTVPLLYLYGPLLYLYARFLSGEKTTFKVTDLLHGLPYLVHTILYTRLYVQSSEFKIYVLTNFVFSGSTSTEYALEPMLIMNVFKLPHMLVYIYLTTRVLKHYAYQIGDASHSFEGLKLDWLRKLTIAFGSFWALWFCYTLAMMTGVRYYVALDYVVTAAFVLIIFGIGLMTLWQPEVFSGLLTFKRPSKYEKSSLVPTQAEAHVEALLHLMEQDRPYQQQGLKLKDLAHHLSIPPHHLSQTLNDQLGQSFYDFVNSYRVAEAKARLANPADNHLTILSIAYEAGFNNKASFNAVFKKHTGLTPSQFKKKAQAGKALSG